MFIFFLLLVLGALGYVLWHVWCVLPFTKPLKWLAVLLLAAILVSMFFFIGGGLDKMPLNLASVMYEVSTSSVIVLLYLVLTFFLMDVARCCHLLPRSLFHESWTATLSILVLLTAVFVAGNIKYRHKVRVPLQLTTDKPIGREYKIVMVSDLHIGYHNRRAELARWIDLINAEQPDFILVAGDIIDMSMRPITEEKMAEEFRRLSAPVYACLGNHEYYSRVPAARQFYKEAGIRLLMDEAVMVDSVITVVGRDDRTNPERNPLSKVVGNAPDSTYTIVLDHQPYELERAEQAKVDFQLSGHTHRGQVWPISWITDAIYECSYGSWQRGNTQFYVSSGLGIWGGKFRIGTQSEYVVATLTSKNNGNNQ
jgi:predicted MPP superfamily phosphohydrolase